MPGYEPSRLKPAQLGYRIIRELMQESLSPAALSRRMRVGKVTIYRHIYAMQAMGIPVHVWRDTGSSYKYVLDRDKFWAWCGGSSTPPKRRSNAKYAFTSEASQP